MASKILNLDDGAEVTEPPKTMPFIWKGRTWHLLSSFNAFAAGALADADEGDELKAFAALFKVLVIEEERPAWTKFLIEHNFDIPEMMAKMSQLLEAAGKDATPSPATSSATPVRKTSGRRSTVASSSIRAAGPKG